MNKSAHFNSTIKQVHKTSNIQFKKFNRFLFVLAKDIHFERT